MFRTVRAMAAVCLASVVLVSGCGGSAAAKGSPADFPRDYAAAAQEFTSSMAATQDDARAALQSRAPGSETRVFSRMQDITARTLRRMQGLQAPHEQHDGFAAVRQGLADQDAALRQVVRATDANDTARLNTALQEYATALTSWQASARQLDDSLGGRRREPGATS